ncbi:hypothetical protein [Pseudoruegeria sp. SK021]|uniref:hypothetical protein n=1 Tax=Pseudoruegeria sp. SK021 TaxID=1933035 RepID=UPI000A2214C7|nr:hypothetical protein [Pseudoruegeria sp. SK021]OSP53718.1 hypothetical protein BV911_16385 [Pseudoruegeria sp. SK021]
MSGIPGRQARAADRHARAADLAKAMIDDALPWLRQGGLAPRNAEAHIKGLFGEFKASAKEIEAAKQMTDALHDVVDAWNARHPQDPLPAPPAITSIRTRNPGWSLARLERLRRWRPWGKALAMRLAQPRQPSSALEAAGLVLACAIRHGGLGDPIFLSVLARWLVTPEPHIRAAHNLPLWIDLKARRRGPDEAETTLNASGSSGLLSRVRIQSGKDAEGPYALRRWYVDPDSLIALTAYFTTRASDVDKATIIAAATSRKGLTDLIRAALDPDGSLGRPPGLNSLIDGAFADLEASSTGLDAVTSGVARGRIRWASPTPEVWEATFRAGPEDSMEAFPALEFDPSPPELDVEEIDDDGFARREARAFSALHALMAQAAPNKDRDLIADHIPLTQQAFASILAAAQPDTAWWPSAARMAFDWYCDLAQTLAPSSVRRYHSALSDRFLDCAGDLVLEASDADALGQVIVEVLEDDPRTARERALTRKLLRRLYRFGVEDLRWTLPEIDQTLFETAADEFAALSFEIAPRLVSAAAFDRARSLIRVHPELNSDGQLAVEAGMILQRRGALRVSEVCKAALVDIEPTLDNPVLFIRPNRFGSNKTRASRRCIRPFAMVSAEESGALRRWVLRRRLLGGDGPLIALSTPVGLARISSASLGRLITDVLRRATGHDDISNHSLRHAALTDLERAMTESRHPEPHPLMDRAALGQRLCGLSNEEATRAAETICPAVRRRDGMAALAAHAGHRSAATTATTYIHGWDLRVFEAVARRIDRVAYDRMAAAISDRIVWIETATQTLPRGPDSDDAASDLADPVELIEALRLIEGGVSRADVSAAVRMSEADLEVAENVARSLAELKTRKGSPRFFLKNEAGCLAPKPPRSAAEIREGKTLLREFWKLRHTHRHDLTWWCAVNLMRATRTNTGLRLTQLDEVIRWRALISGVSTRRWALHLEGQPEAEERAEWDAVCPADTPWRKKPGAHSVTLIVRLARPDGENPDTRLHEVSGNYASGAPIFAAHALAIALGLTPRVLGLSLSVVLKVQDRIFD